MRLWFPQFWYNGQSSPIVFFYFSNFLQSPLNILIHLPMLNSDVNKENIVCNCGFACLFSGQSIENYFSLWSLMYIVSLCLNISSDKEDTILLSNHFSLLYSINWKKCFSNEPNIFHQNCNPLFHVCFL